MSIVHRCERGSCKATAVWHDAGSSPGWYLCDQHIAREGCSCRWDEETETFAKDAQGRDLPCVEYDYREEGFER